jgi:hypothetical protein
MNVGFFSTIPGLSLAALWLAYVLLGWYLSFYNIFWFVGAAVVAGALALCWKSISWLENLIKSSSTGLLMILSMLMLSILLVATIGSTLIPIVVMPLPITFLANVEMRFAGFSKLNTILILAAIAGFGLALGEGIDIFFLSSTGY